MSNFIYWKLPEKPEIFTIKAPIERNITNFTNLEEGFVLFPFQKEKEGKCFIGKIETAPITQIDCPIYNSQFLDKTYSSQDYTELVHAALDQIKKGTLQKVVLAQMATQQLEANFNLSDFFNTLCHTYPKAFVYCLGFGNEIWIGASPEVFLKKESNKYQTIALAGTRQLNSETQFGVKEQKEQAFVREYILQKITDLGSQSIHVSELHEINTGNMWHLINEISFENQSPFEIIKNLHPTPAVCGFPLQKSLDFINQFESFDREYYAGYLGPVSLNENFSLWVNLRCAKIKESYISFYAGAGIVSESDPRAEHLETERKMDTLRRLL